MSEIEYVARISHGKDSLKMLDVIVSRGLPLDRITSSDVWATDTIPADLPPMREFRAEMDERIFQMYGIRVERLCARNKDGSKRTYEQMFYHIPKRRSQTVQVERETRRIRAGSILGFPDLWNPWCQKALKRSVTVQPGHDQRVSASEQERPLVSATQGSSKGLSRDFLYATNGSDGASNSNSRPLFS